MIHLTLNQISAFIDSELPEVSVELVRLHLSSCLECTERFGLIEEQEGALARLLEHDPGDAFFAGFSDRVLGAPRTAARTPEPPARTSQPEPPARAERPQARARTPRPAAPGAQPGRGPGPARNLAALAVLGILATVAGIVVTRPEMMARFGHPSPADQAPRRSAEPPQPSPQSSPGAADLLERAAARASEAQRAGTPEAYDDAATAWEAAIPALHDNPEELAAGLREIASARFAAWSAGPTPERRDAAASAVRAYLLCAPAGDDRDQAWTWLARLKR